MRDSIIQSKLNGGIQVLDPELQIPTLLIKLSVQGLMPKDTPWKHLMAHKLSSIRSKKGGQWPPYIHFILCASNVHSNGSSSWWRIWKAWVSIKHHLSFQQSDSKDVIARQPLFWNGELVGMNSQMFSDASYTFGCH